MKQSACLSICGRSNKAGSRFFNCTAKKLALIFIYKKRIKLKKMKSDITAEVKININAPVSKVWEALTNPEVIKKYLFGTETITDWKVGSSITFKGEWEGKQYEDKGTILDIEENKLIKYTYWSSMSGAEDTAENYLIITYEISGEDNDVKLTITQENIPDKNRKEISEENWAKVMSDLKDVVEEQSISFAK